MTDKPQIFLSHAGMDAFEASLLQVVVEKTLADLGVIVWSYLRDQSGDEQSVALSIREQMRKSCALIFLLSPYSLETRPTQWMELAYAHAFDVSTFVLLHHLTFDELRIGNVPPLVLAGHCTPAIQWESLMGELRQCCPGNINL